MKRNCTTIGLLVCLMTSPGCDQRRGRFEGEFPADCTDGADNDRDGRFDCSDDGCTSAPACGGAPPTSDPALGGDAGAASPSCMAVAGYYRGLERGSDCSSALHGVQLAVHQSDSDCTIGYDLTFDYADGTSDTERDIPGTLEPLGSDVAQLYQSFSGGGSVLIVFEASEFSDRVDADITIDTGSRVCEYTTRFGP